MYIKYEHEAQQFCKAIKAIASDTERLNNLESYLTYHFDTWLERWANTPEGISADLQAFAEMKL